MHVKRNINSLMCKCCILTSDMPHNKTIGECFFYSYLIWFSKGSSVGHYNRTFNT